MANKLGELSDFFSPGLVLTVLGREYTVPLPSAELGLWCRLAAERAGQVSAASTPEQMRAAVARMRELPEPPGEGQTLTQHLLGAAYQQMANDRVPDPFVEFCGSAAYIWIISGEETVRRWWESGGRPEAQRPANNRAERRAAQRAESSSRTTSTGVASTTQTAGSGTGTSFRKSGSRRRANRSRGRGSSRTGG